MTPVQSHVGQVEDGGVVLDIGRILFGVELVGGGGVSLVVSAGGNVVGKLVVLKYGDGGYVVKGVLTLSMLPGRHVTGPARHEYV